MKIQAAFLLLISNAAVHADSQQYTLKNTMAVPTKQVVVNYMYYTIDQRYGIPGDSRIQDTYAIPLNDPIKSGQVYAWNAEQKQHLCYWDKKEKEKCVDVDSYPSHIDVILEDGKKITSPLEPSYDRMFWVILPDGKIQRVYQIYYNENGGTIFPFVNDDPNTKQPDMNRADITFKPKN